MSIKILSNQQQQWKEVKVFIQSTNQVIVQKINIENSLIELKNCIKQNTQLQFKDIIFSIGQKIYSDQDKIKEIYDGNFQYIQAQLILKKSKHKFFIQLTGYEPIECVGKPEWKISQIKSRIFQEYVKDPSLQLNDFTILVNNSLVDEDQQISKFGQNCVIKFQRTLATDSQIPQIPQLQQDRTQNQTISYQIHYSGRVYQYKAPSNTSLGFLKIKYVTELVFQNQSGNIENYIFRVGNMVDNLNLTLQNIKDYQSSENIVFFIEKKKDEQKLNQPSI